MSAHWRELRDPNIIPECEGDSDLILCPTDCTRWLRWDAARGAPPGPDAGAVMAENQAKERTAMQRTFKRRRHIAFLVGLGVLLVLLLLVGKAQAAEYPDVQHFIDAEITGPHHSAITGQMMVNVLDWYKVPLRATVAILGAETSIGDPDLGGVLVKYHAYGCIKASPGWRTKKWAEFANGTVRVRGVDWVTWPTPELGMYGWGRYMKLTFAKWLPNLHLVKVVPWWPEFAAVYYGRGVPGYDAYVANVKKIDLKYTALARAHGYDW